MRRVTTAPILCPLDPVGDCTQAQLELAFELGANEVLVPMIRRPDEVETRPGVRRRAPGRERRARQRQERRTPGAAHRAQLSLTVLSD
jgi:hypothetical protein